MIEKSKNALRRLLPQSAFARGVSVLVGGTASAQFVLVLAAPLLTRIYTPEDFGMLAVYVSVLALLSVVSSLRYEQAIPLPEDDQVAANLTVLCLILVVINSLLWTVVVFNFAGPIAVALGANNLEPYFWMLPVGVLLSGAYSVFSYWGVREKRFKTIATTKLRQSVITVATQLAGYKLGGFALILGQGVGHGVGVTSMATPALRSGFFMQISGRGIVNVSVRYKRFPMFSTLDAFINKIGTQLPPLLFAGIFGPAAAGFYSLADRLMQLPISIVGAAVGQVFLSQAGEAKRNGEIGVLVMKLHLIMSQVGMAPALMIILIGPDLFELAFGERWSMAGIFAQWMSPWLYLVFVVSPLTTLIAVMERQSESLIIQTALLLSRIASIYIGAELGGIILAVALFAGVSALFWFAQLLWIGHMSGLGVLKKLITQTISAFLVGLACVSPIIFTMLSQGTRSETVIWSLPACMVLIVMNYWRLLKNAR